jgi:hypothetical protein
MFFRVVYIRLFESYCPNRFELQYDIVKTYETDRLLQIGEGKK